MIGEILLAIGGAIAGAVVYLLLVALTMRLCRRHNRRMGTKSWDVSGVGEFCTSSPPQAARRRRPRRVARVPFFVRRGPAVGRKRS